MKVWITSRATHAALRAALGIAGADPAPFTVDASAEALKAVDEPLWCGRCHEEASADEKRCRGCGHCFECGAYARPDAAECPECGEALKAVPAEGADSHKIPKLGFGQAGPNGERWITLHPHGDEGHSVRVLIRPSGKDGTAHVIGGAGGRLNYLKVQMRTPEEYRQMAADRKAKQKADAAKRRAEDAAAAKEAGQPMAKRPGRAAALKALRDNHRAEQDAIEKQIAAEMGWDDAALDEESTRGLDDKTAAKAEREHRTKLRADLRAAVSHARDWLVNDTEARAAAFSGDLPFAGGPDQLGAADLIGTDTIRRGLGYRPMSAGLDDRAKRAEKARFIETRMREEVEKGTPAEAALLARRLAEHRAIAPDEVAQAPAQVLAGLARAVADRVDHLKAVADTDDPAIAEAIEALESVAEQAGTTEDALGYATTHVGEQALRDGLAKAAELGLLDPDRVGAMKEQAEAATLARVGAPPPEAVTAEAVDDLTDEQVAALAEAAAKRARSSVATPVELREQAAALTPEAGGGKKRRGGGGGGGGGGGRDPNDTRTVDLEDAIEAQRQRDALAEEAIPVGTASADEKRDFLKRAIDAGVIGKKDGDAAAGEQAEAEKPKPPRRVHAADPQQAYRVLLLHKKLEAAKRKAAEVEAKVKAGEEVPGVDYDPARGAEAQPEAGRGGLVDLSFSEEDAAAVQQDVERSLKTAHARALLGTAEEVAKTIATQAHLTPEEAHRTLHTHLAFGAADALNSHAQEILGGPSLDRQVIDTLGAEGAAQLLAWATHTHRGDDVAAIGEAVGDFHQRTQTRKAQEALEDARAAYEEANELHRTMTEEGPRGDLKEWQALNNQRLKHLEHARKTVARTLGSLEATAALHASLARKPPAKIRTSLGATTVETAAAQAHAIGLAPDDFDVEHDGKNAWLTVKPSGFEKLVRPPDQEHQRLQRDISAIKGGEQDEKGWLPAGFARRTDPKPYEGPSAPLHAQPLDYALKDHGDFEQALRTHIAQRVHDGWRPADIAADVQNLGHHEAQIRAAHGNRETDEVRAWKEANPEPSKTAEPDPFDMFATLDGPAAGDGEPSQAWKDWDAARQEVAARGAVRDFHAAIERVMPSRDAQVGAVQLAERYGEHFRGIADEHAAAAGGNLAGALHQQQLHPEHAKDAAFRALARHPAAVAAFKEPGDLTHDEQAALRQAFVRYFDGKTGSAPVPTPAEAVQKWAASNPKPDETDAEGVARWQAQHDAVHEKATDAFEPYMPPGERLARWKAKNPEPAKEKPADEFDMFGGGPTGPAPAEHVEAARVAHAAAQEAEDQAYGAAHEAEQRKSAAKQSLQALVEKHGESVFGDEHESVRAARAELDEATKAHGEASRAHIEAARRREEAERQAFAVEHGHTSPEWQAWKKQHDEALRGFRRDHAKFSAPDWQTYTLTHGNARDAYAAMQDVVRGRFFDDFRAHYQALAGEPLKAGVTTIANAERHRVAFDPDHREHVRKLRARAQSTVQAKDARGRYMTDQVRAKTERALQEQKAKSERQTSAVSGAPPTAEEMRQRLKAGPDERTTIGAQAEAHVAEHVRQLAPMIDPSKPFKARMGISMDGTEKGKETVKQQRAVKAWKRAGKLGLFLGPGSGKTNVSFGAFGELRKEGRAARGLFAVPSAVQGQFGTEALAYLEPGAMKWWANPGAGREDRMKAYRDPDTHAVVVTHQALRDDVTHMVANHLGISEEDVAARMTGFDREGNEAPGAWGRDETDRHVREALEKHGAHGLLDFLAVDEGHAALNRQGKQDSHLARVVDSLGRNAKHAGFMTGSPVKNDPSEVYDWLAKVAHHKYHDGPGGVSRAEFMRRYGSDLPATAEALRRELAPYTVTGRVDPGTSPRFHHETLPPTPEQHERLQAIDTAYQRARLAARRGEVDVEALRQLMPKKFAKADPADHEAIARRYGTPFKLAGIRDAAYRHAVNLHEDGAKLRRVVELANHYRDHVDEHGENRPKPGVIFAHDLGAIPKIEAALKAHGHRVVTLAGNASGDAKQAAAEHFQSGGADVMILSDAGEAGINLQRGKYLIHHDVPQTFKTWDQRTARVNRLGQEDDPDIHTLKVDHEFEHRAWDRVERKRALGDAVMDGGGEALDDTGLAPFIRARMHGAVMGDDEEADAPPPGKENAA